MMLNQPPPELFPERPVRSEYNVGPSYRMRRVVSIAVLLAMAGGGMYLAFAHSSRPVDGAAVPTIKADAAYKERPEQPGGIEIPHQDVDVYKELGNEAEAQDTAEHMLPVAETPQPVPGEAKPPVLEAPPVAPANTVESLFDTTPTAVPVEEAKKVERVTHEIPTTVIQSTKVTPVPAPVEAAEAPKVEEPKAEEPKPIKKVVDKVAEKAPVKTQEPKVAAVSNINHPVESVDASTASSGPVVQLAASTDQAAAQKMVSDYEAKYAPALSGVGLRVVRADLGSKGIYYRVQTKPVSADEASRVCAALKKMKAGCFVVR